jgi:hypothetical protein
MKGKEYKNKKLSTRTKDVFSFKFKDNIFPERVVREVFKKKNTEIHYPFYDDKQMYKYIDSLTFNGISPDNVKGIVTAVGRGLGFTRNLKPIIKELEKFTRISQIIISKNDPTSIKGNKIIFSTLDLESIFNFLRPFNDKQSNERRKVTNNLLSEILPNKFKKDVSQYTKGDLTTFILNKDLKNNKISDEDAKNIVEILPEELKEQQTIYKIEEKVEIIKIKKAKREFEKLKSQKSDSDSLEKRWHRFFKENDWIFSYVLLLPIVIYGDEIYVGGKNIKNRGGKIADFLYKNSLTNNACILEIKTHKTPICNKSAYRGTNVFPLNGKFTGAINQTLIQKDKLLKKYASLLQEEKESGKADEFFDVFNPRCVLVVGLVSDMTKNQRNNFDIFRNSMGNVEIITFDEIEEKLDNFANLLKIE